MNIDKKLEALQQIRDVDAPPFLITRIREKIQALQPDFINIKWKWTFAVLSVIVLTINVALVLKMTSRQNNSAKVEDMITTLHISSSNQLYHE